MAATRNKSPFSFEEHQLTFFPDLSRATLEWRRSLKPLTSILTKFQVPCRWGTPRSLLITQESGTMRVLGADEISSTLQTLGLPTTPEGSQTSAPVPRPIAWDPNRVRPFVPAAMREDPATTAVP
ncbi:Hypothetical predicted protein [Pelobates cultripes]|uniref:Uncharacterized protein n=1 Tax=Pelobates cultripes TaxID=61616 RepID=A0AAD1W3N4_PELCU|nr:Hypothetical predicted protein [Pelobates cultripes]